MIKLFARLAFLFGVLALPAIAAEETVDMTLENSLSLRDPFSRPNLRKESKEDLSKLPDLERFAVEELKLVGVITGMRKNKALLTTPTGKMFIVTEQMRVGTRHGVVRGISKSGIDIEERVLNVLGQEERVEARIDFKEPGGSKE